MDQRERYADDAEVMRIALEALQSRIWTALPCVVQSFPAASGLDPMMLDAQPVLAGSYVNSSGQVVTLQMPLLVDVPVWFPSGGGATLTFPIKPGDECLVVFSARCIDAWWQLGVGPSSAPGVIPPDARMHNLSDGIAYVGLRNAKRSYPVDAANVQLRMDDGSAKISLNVTTRDITVNSTQGNISLLTSGNGKNINMNTSPNGGVVNINGVTIDANGTVRTPSDVIAGTISLKNHKTTLVQSGSQLSGPPQ